MNVGELRAAIKDLPDDMDVLTARDEEGNGFHKLDELDTYLVPRQEIGERYVETLLDEDDLEEDDDPDDYVTMLVLWP